MYDEWMSTEKDADFQADFYTEGQRAEKREHLVNCLVPAQSQQRPRLLSPEPRPDASIVFR